MESGKRWSISGDYCKEIPANIVEQDLRRVGVNPICEGVTSTEQIFDLRVDNASAFGGNTVLSEWMGYEN